MIDFIAKSGLAEVNIETEEFKIEVKRSAETTMVASTPALAHAPVAVAPAPAPKKAVDVFALQTKLKAKGYYKGPIDGVVGKGTRAALNQFMQNR